MKKSLAILLALLLFVSLALTGCQNTAKPEEKTDTSTTEKKEETKTEEKKEDTSSTSKMSAAGEFPIVTEPTTLKVLTVPSSYVEDYNTNYAVGWLEEKTGVKIDWNLLSSTDAATKISLLLATNAESEMPDVFYTGIGRSLVESYGVQGVLVPLEGYIEDYGVNMKALYAHNDTVENQLTCYDGHIYWLGRYYETVHTRSTQKLWMNDKWLENVGMDAPKTTDEFYDVLKAFQEQDANGNGDATDEIPFLYYNGGYNGQFGIALINAFTYCPPDKGYCFGDDGKITVPFIQDGFKDALVYLKKLYDEKLIDNECFSMTIEQAKALAASENGNRVGTVTGGTVGIFSFDDPEILNMNVIDPLKGPNGLQVTAYEMPALTPFFCITSYCDIPEIAYRWADAQIYDSSEDIANGDYTWLNWWYGKQGEGWDVADEGSVGFTGEPAAYKWLFSWGETTNTHLYETFLINMPESWKPLIQTDDSAVYNQERVIYEATIDHMLPYSKQDTFFPATVSMTDADAATIADIQTTLNTYRDECIAKFIRGEMSLDSDWDAYKSEIEKIGLPTVLEIYQKYWDALQK